MMYIVLCSMLYHITLSQGIQDYNSELVNNYVHNYVTNVYLNNNDNYEHNYSES